MPESGIRVALRTGAGTPLEGGFSSQTKTCDLMTKKLILPLVLAVTMLGCRAEVEEPGRLPDVEVSGGQMPRVDVEPADIRVTEDTQVVRVPNVEVVPRDP